MPIATPSSGRRLWILLALLGPIAVLAGAWLLVTRVLLAPGIPTASTPPEQVARFIIDPQGLPRLDRARFEACLAEVMPRFLADTEFRERFLREVRIAAPEDQEAFRVHLFLAIKPLVMDDVHRYHALTGAERDRYVDERIVAYNRLRVRGSHLSIGAADVFGPAAPSPQQALTLIREHTTQDEQRLGLAYAAALDARVQEILADPSLWEAFERRIEAGDRTPENGTPEAPDPTPPSGR